VTTQKAELLYERISVEKGMFSLCERVYEPQNLYNPSDWMWNYTVSNNITDDWLWYLVKIQAADAWDITRGDSTIKIAVVDDGFDYQHLELQGKIDPPYDFYSGIQETTTSDHGTSVASILAAETVDQGETSIGSMASIGYKSKIMVSQYYLPACLYASTVLNAEILSISWYHTSCSSNEYFNAVEQEILNNGTLIVRAAGNGSANCGGGRLYPFSGFEDSRVIVVSSTDFDDNHTSPFSNIETTSFYPEVDICAPGYRIMGAVHSQNGTVTWPYNGYWGGTSQSTPIVSGVCALIKSVNRCLTPEDIQDIIKQTADPIQDANLYPGMVGAGRINAYRAVSLAQNYHNNNDTITSNETWSTDSYRGGTIVVDSLATLTITGTLHCSSSARLIVRPGGKLVIDGGTLTSACDGEMWQGIEVVGDRTKRQLAQYQGIVELRNGATIENAHCGIRTGLQGDASYATTGGIIRAEDAYFINNRRSVEFLSYTNHALNGSVTNNQSYFTGCSFTVNDDNLFSQGNGQFIDHVTLWEVRGIAFNGCTFENATTAQGDRRHAIYAEDAGFTVDKRCTDPVYNPSTCTCNAFVRSTFSGFAIAIEANTSGNQFPVKIDHSRFSENGTGVRINGNHFATVTRCDFDLTTNPQEWRYLYGLYLSGCSGFKVEANQFDGTVQYVDGITTGVYVNGSGSSVNSLYKNEFDNLSYGIHAYGNNSGLQIRCNEFDGSGADIFVPSGSSIASSQGSLQTSAGNKFMQAYGYNIFNGGAQTITYYYKNSTTNSYAEPVLNSSGVSVTPSNTANNCASTLCGITPLDPTPFQLAGFQSDMNAYTTAMAGNNDADGRDIAGGTGVETQNFASLQQVLSETYYAAVRTLMSDSLLDLGTLEQWHAAAQPIADPYSLTETRFCEGYAETFVSDADDAEMANYAEFHAMKLALRVQNDNLDNQDNSGTPFVNWYALTPAQIAQLQTIAERNTGRASVMAKGVLCFFYGICYEDDSLVDDNADNNAGTRAKRVTTDITDDAALTVYPNPTDDLLFVELRGAEIARVALYDLQGRMVTGAGAHAGAPQQGTTATMNIRNVPAGVYLLRVTDMDGKEYHQKIVKR